MAPTDLSVQEQQAAARKQRVVNDFSIQVATVNGSGSQTANLVLLRSILLMGVPVSGKNMFPSNIAGLPTWYTIRASKDGYVGRKKEVDFLVAMNAETAKEDVLTLEPGAAVVYDEPVTLNAGALKAGFDYASANFTKQDPFCIEPMNKTAGKILIEGNAAAAIGCMMAGVTVVAWYPITPSSSLCESLIGYMKKYRVDKDGKATFAIVQAEDEIASLGMVIGASWAGARSMTA